MNMILKDPPAPPGPIQSGPTQPSQHPTHPAQPSQHPAHVADPIDTVRFMFAVGIECSCPKIDGGTRVDELQSTGHYDNWKKDLSLVRELGLRYLRYGP